MADSILGRPGRSFAEVAGSLLGKRKKEAKKQALEALGWNFLFLRRHKRPMLRTDQNRPNHWN